MLETLANLIAPLSVEEFFRDVHRKKPLLIKGGAEKFSDVLDWDSLSDILSQNGIWSAKSLELVNQGKKVDPADYCIHAPDRDNRPSQMVDMARVKKHLQAGASLVLNDAGTLSRGITAVTRLLAESLAATVQANIYCSWKSYQGFSTHYDVHDVWALHIAGTKTWNLYRRHFENPIPHPKFRGLGQEFHKTHSGPATETVTMEPGDLLYIPRGWYHDALATSEASLHITYGTTPLIGLDAVSHLFEAAVDDPFFRADLPASGTVEGHTEADLKDALSVIAQKIGNLINSDSFVKRIQQAQKAQRPLMGEISLPAEAKANYSIKNKEIRVFEQDGKLVLGTERQSLPIPSGMEPPVRWIVKQNQFDESDFGQAFPALSEIARRQLLTDLCAMRVLVTS